MSNENDIYIPHPDPLSKRVFDNKVIEMYREPLIKRFIL